MRLKALNRATLARQMLLERERAAPRWAIERLAGLQAQEAKPPFIGLWTRLERFRREDLTRPLRRRQLVRVVAMRATLHLLSAADFVRLRPALQPALSAAFGSHLSKHSVGLDLQRLTAKARSFFDGRQATFEALRSFLAKSESRWDPRVMAYAVRTHLPLVQVPTDDAWGFPSTADFALAESWLGVSLKPDDKPDALVLRYLAAFGPATPADAQAWSGLRGLAETFDRLRPRLRIFRDERGRELFDLPKAPRPPADTPAPVRFLPEYDNAILSHADRSRIIADEHRPRVVTRNLRVLATFLVDGVVAGTWSVERSRSAAKVTIKPFGSLPKAARTALVEEGRRLVSFMEPEARAAEVRVVR